MELKEQEELGVKMVTPSTRGSRMGWHRNSSGAALAALVRYF